MTLTKNQLLKGVEDSEVVKIEKLEQKGFEDPHVEIRPLSDKEYSEIEEITLQGLDIDGNIDRGELAKLQDADDEEAQKKIMSSLGVNMDINKLQKLQKESDYVTCKYGLSVGDEEWTKEDVGKLPQGVPNEIADKVLEITGVEVGIDDVENFRE